MAYRSRYLVQKNPEYAAGEPIPSDEPVLVIRAQDKMAVKMLAYYISEYEAQLSPSESVMMRLGEHMQELVAWRNRNRSRIKVAD